MEFKLLKSIKYQNEFIHTWPHVVVGDDGREHRIYYKLDDPGHGFDFYSVMWVSCSADKYDF